MTMTHIDLTPFLQALIGLLAALITHRLIPWLKARTDNERQAALSAAIRCAVFAAEQIYGAGQGAEKLKYAQSALREKGFDVDTDAIEAAVYEALS